jgi:anti-sigma-K factor RskA
MSDERRRPPRDRFDDLKSAYALGALTEDERREFEGYLATYPELQAEVEALVSVADLLALAPQEHEPPPELRRNLLNRIGGATDATLAEAPQRRAGLRRLFGPGGLAAAAVAVLAVVGLFAWNASLRASSSVYCSGARGRSFEGSPRKEYLCL